MLSSRDIVALSLLIAIPAFAQEPTVPGMVALRAAAIASPNVPKTRNDVMKAVGYLIGHPFELFDSDHDGALDKDEWLESTFATYAVFNEKRDGRITLDDYRQELNGPDREPNIVGHIPEKSVERAFKSLDHDRKGYLDIEDFRRESLGWLMLNDVNRDGRVTFEEIQQTVSRRR